MKSFAKLVSVVLLFTICFIALGSILVCASSTQNVVSASSLVDSSSTVNDVNNIGSTNLTVRSGAVILRLISILLPLIGILGTVITIIVFIVRWFRSDSEKKLLLKENLWKYIITAVIFFFGGIIIGPILTWIMLMSSRG